MKKYRSTILICFTIIIVCIGLVSFINAAENKIQDNWSEWSNDDCFKGIDYRVRKGGYNSYSNKWDWYVQFRNRYNGDVHFSYSVSEPGTMTNPDHRQDVSKGEIGETIGSIFNANRCHVRIGRLRIGNDDSGAYVPCDN